MENPLEKEHELSMNTKPFLSMKFASEEDAYNFYNDYGRHTGFSVRKSTTRFNKENILVSRMFVCSKEGERVKRKVKNTSYSKTESSHTRCGCKACMEIKLQGESTWKVTRFVEEHNHGFVTPTKRNMLRSQQRLSKATVNLIKQFDESSIGATRSDERKFTVMRYNEILTRLNRIVLKASMYENSFDLVMEGLARLEFDIDKSNNEEAEKFEIKGLNTNLEEVGSVPNAENQVTSSSNKNSLKPPPIVQTKGSGKLFVNAREQRRHGQRKSNLSQELNAGKDPSDGSKAPRRCHSCDGCGHDVRNCPRKKPRLTSDIEGS